MLQTTRVAGSLLVHVALSPASAADSLENGFKEVCIGLIYILFVFQDTS
jgi:hypothetical protein